MVLPKSLVVRVVSKIHIFFSFTTTLKCFEFSAFSKELYDQKPRQVIEGILLHEILASR